MYSSENGKLKEQKKTIRKFNLNSFYKKLGEQAKESDRLNTSLLVIEFKNNENCSCKLYNLSFSEGSDLKDLSFFD